MTKSRGFVSFRTFTLAFAVVLSPALMQTSSCGSMYTLTALEVIVDGQDQIVGFDPAVRSYAIRVTSEADTALVRAFSASLSAEVWLDVENDSSGPTTTPALVGGGEFTIALEPGDTTVTVNVKSGGLASFYTVGIGRGLVFPCTEQGILDAIALGGGPHYFACDGPTFVVTGDVIGINNDVILDGEGNLRVGYPGDRYCVVIPDNCGVTLVNQGTLTLINTLVSGWGDGIANFNEGTLTLINSTVWAGSPSQGILNYGTLTLINSTVSAPEAISTDGTLTVTNSVVDGHIRNSGMLTLSNSTVSPSIWQGSTAISTSGTLTATNSVVDGGCYGGIASAGYNIESPGDTCGFDQPTDQVNVTAEQLGLGPLQDNGGPTMTHALLPGSVAIDWIPEADCVDADGQPLTTDQRGEPRPETGGTMCDVGAFEVQP